MDANTQASSSSLKEKVFDHDGLSGGTLVLLVVRLVLVVRRIDFAFQPLEPHVSPITEPARCSGVVLSDTRRPYAVRLNRWVFLSSGMNRRSEPSIMMTAHLTVWDGAL